MRSQLSLATSTVHSRPLQFQPTRRLYSLPLLPTILSSRTVAMASSIAGGQRSTPSSSTFMNRAAMGSGCIRRRRRARAGSKPLYAGSGCMECLSRECQETGVPQIRLLNMKVSSFLTRLRSLLPELVAQKLRRLTLFLFFLLFSVVQVIEHMLGHTLYGRIIQRIPRPVDAIRNQEFEKRLYITGAAEKGLDTSLSYDSAFRSQQRVIHFV